MKSIIIIKKMGSKHLGPILPICDCIGEDAKDGDEVEIEAKGILRDRDGKRFLEVTEINGEPVEDMEQDPVEESMPPHMMDSEDALMNFMKQLTKK